MSQPFNTLRWVGAADGYLELLDQTQLPDEIIYLECRTAEDVWQAIKQLSVRGAPAIGVASAYGVCVGANEGRDLDEVCDYLATSRPTAVNLFWALERMRRVGEECSSSPSLKGKENSLAEWLLVEARAIDQEDREYCAAMGRHGADLLVGLPAGAGVLTPCNAGALVSGSGDGTALAIIFEGARRGKRQQVWADETRPLLQLRFPTMLGLQQ